MIKTILGIILLLIPFILISKFQDKKKGFFYILTFFIFFHLITAIITQFFGIFNYPIILSINIFSCLLIIFKTNFKGLKPTKENIKKIKIDWILLFVLLIISLQLYQVHFNYTGKVSSINQDSKEVKNLKYIYPYFSDEWCAISLIEYSIETGKLPFTNPLWNDYYFPNLEFAFHSFLSEFFLLLDLNPLTFYSTFSIIIGLLICFLVYFILRFNNMSRFASAISSLSIPLITNSGNFLGIWYLIPIVLGLVCMLLGFIFISINDKKMVLFSSFLILFFYPPLIAIFTFALIPYFLFSANEKPIKNLFSYFLIFILVIIILLISIKKLPNITNFIISKIYYINFTKNMIPDYSVWKIIPLFSIIFAILGLKKFKEKIWFFLPTIVGLAYWTLYSVILWRFIIEYERVVFITSVLIIIISGFGINLVINFLEKYINKKTLKILKIIILLIFLFSIINYTSSDKWESIKFNAQGKIISPMPPANVYLQEEDLKIFENIKEKNFIAPPWKGLVIGVATKNYPLETKASVITNQILNYNGFVGLNCTDKKQTAINYKLNYVYSKNFTCDSFNLIKAGNELSLYEFREK